MFDLNGSNSLDMLKLVFCLSTVETVVYCRSFKPSWNASIYD